MNQTLARVVFIVISKIDFNGIYALTISPHINAEWHIFNVKPTTEPNNKQHYYIQRMNFHDKTEQNETMIKTKTRILTFIVHLK